MISLRTELSAFYAARPNRQAQDAQACVAIVIPTLNEARHIIPVLRMLLPGAQRMGAAIIVADGGSDDGTVDLVLSEARRVPGLFLLHNPRKLQSAAVNLAVANCPPEVDWLIRVDAHGAYPDNYCEVLLDEACQTGADSVVVTMLARGDGGMQNVIAAAQNGFVGNGGSAHRGEPKGRYVEHGHHALMRRAAFSKVGGYDETFTHNEDAELDARLRKAGCRIWLTGKTQMIYFPRDSLTGLARQYFNFGRGRLATAIRHPDSFRKRHLVLVSLAPAACLAVLSGLHVIFAVPLLLWLLICCLAGLLMALQHRRPALAASGIAAGLMQMGWSAGFWNGLYHHVKTRFVMSAENKHNKHPMKKEGS
ncbi:glycosyltransferase family 2 protein [Yoonia sp.]|uniref:glycosyltransferase family 2 protein n=1 Tax=Yoonia sp. TaxID=2212373 RepID=UPI00391B63C3